MTKPVGWLLNLNDSLGKKCDLALSKLEGLFLESDSWLEEIRKENQNVPESNNIAKVGPAKRLKKSAGRSKRTKALPLRLPTSDGVSNVDNDPKETVIEKNEDVKAVKKVTQKRRTKKPKNPEPVDKPHVPPSTPLTTPIIEKVVDEAQSQTPSNEDIPDIRQNDFLSSVIASPCPVIESKESADSRLIESPKYMIVKEIPEKLLIEQPKTPSSVIRRRKLPKTPSIEGFELEIVNPVDSITKPRQSLTHAKSFNSPKVESWTSQFLKHAAPEPLVTSPIREVPKPIEIVPPAIVNIRADPPSLNLEPPPVSEQPRKLNPALAVVMTSNETIVESPLTRARRIDSQNTWREQQLSKFFVSKAEVLKSAMDTLKVVKDEERTSKIHSVQQPIKPELSPPSLPEESKDEPKYVLTSNSVISDVRAVVLPVIDSPRVSGPVRLVFDSPKKTPQKSPVKQQPVLQVNSPQKSPIKQQRRESYQDVFKIVSPLKAKKETIIFDNSSLAESFVASFEAPTLDNTEIPAEMCEEPQTTTIPHQTIQNSEIDDPKLPQKREPSSSSLSLEERLKRQRLKERQQQTIEKRNMLIKKAQEAKAKQEEMVQNKQRPPPSALGPKPSQIKPQPPSTLPQRNGSSVNSLHKTAIFNSSKSNLSISGKPEFKTPVAKIKSPAPIKMTEKVLSSPSFPEIPSDDDDYLKKVGQGLVNRPAWAATPALKAALVEQQNVATDKIFDKIQPVRLEDIFKNKTFKRGRNSTIPFL